MNIKIIKGWDMFFNHGFHDHLSSSEGPTSAEIDHAPKKKSHSRGIRTKLKPFRAGCTKLHLLGKRPLNKSGPQRGLIRQMGRWLKWMSWSKLKLTMKYHETMKHSELFDIFDKRSWHQLFFEVPLKPCFTVGLTRWRQAQSHLSSLWSHPIFSVGSGLPFFEHVLRTEFFLNMGYGGVWYIYTTPHYMDLYGTFAGKTYDNTMRLRLLRKLLLDKANMPPMSKTTHFPEAGLSVLLDLQYCRLYSTASWMTKYAAEICRALLPNCYLQHYCIDSVSCL